MTPHRGMRALFLATVAWAVAIVWLAPHPPMIDLPQHAGQVALLSQLLAGHSPWSHLVQPNLLTPYLGAFAPALPLSYVLPVATVLKILLSVAYLAFVWLGVALRRRFGADARLDWLCVPGFFGYAYEWGFLTFLLAAPIGLGLILTAERYAEKKSLAQGVAVAMLGVVLLWCHGLTFLFACGVGVALLWVRAQDWRERLISLWPYVVLGAAAIAMFIVLRRTAASFPIPPTVPAVNWHFGLRYEILAYSFGIRWSRWAALASLAFLVAPWLMGLRVDLRRAAAWPAFMVVGIILAFVPHFVFETTFAYQRFAMFLFPAYAWLFSSSGADHGARAAAWSGRVGVLLLVLACWSVQAVNTAKTWRFAEEAADFDAIAAAVEPGQRALSLVFDRGSDAGASYYTHYAVWYQAEHQGFVDFSFAWYSVLPVRFRPDALPKVNPDMAWHPERFDWKLHRGADYRYFFVRRKSELPADFFKGAECPPSMLLARGTWQVFERRDCSSAGAKR